MDPFNLSRARDIATEAANNVEKKRYINSRMSIELSNLQTAQLSPSAQPQQRRVKTSRSMLNTLPLNDRPRRSDLVRVCYTEPRGNRKDRQEYAKQANPIFLFRLLSKVGPIIKLTPRYVGATTTLRKLLKCSGGSTLLLKSTEEMEVVDEDESTQDMDSTTVENETVVEMEVSNSSR